MNNVRFAFLSAFVWVASGGAVFAEGKLPFDLKPTCNVSLEFGNIVKGHDKNVGELNNCWMEKSIIGFGLQVIFRSADTLRAATEMKMFNEYPRYDLGASRRLYHYPYVREAQAIHSFIDNEILRVVGGIGYFPYKYNDNVRNPGEYLFRSTAYPQTLSPTKCRSTVHRPPTTSCRRRPGRRSASINAGSGILTISVTSCPHRE